ncbi:MAG: FAD-dependent oxidoreductase, partial [Raoultibacter sp.]
WCTEMMIDPRQIGTATLLYFTTTVHNPETVCSPVPKGGCASFVKALVECCKDAGADLFTNAYVDTITTAGGEAKTVRTKNGDEFKAKNAIVSTINVKDVYDYLGDDAPAEEADYARKLKYSDFAALNQSFALKKEPEFKAGPGVKRMFNLESAPWEKEYLQTFSNYTLGEFSPHLPNITMPYINDPSRCPAGQAVMNIYTYAPYKLWGDEKNWETHGQELMDQVWDHVKGMTTNITDDDIIGRWGFTPVDYEKWNPAMHNGDIAMIGMQPSQLYDMRPFPGKGHLYHGDIENLYIIGTCGHPGAGIAASARAGIQTVLDDFGVDFRDVVKK